MELTATLETGLRGTPAKAMPRPRKQYRWDVREQRETLARELMASLGLSPVVARVIANRGLASTAAELEQFARPTLACLHDPFLMVDMDKAVDRLVRAQRSGESVVVYGDYDTDGATSTALLMRTFERIGLRASYYIPHRLEEGYGLNASALNALAQLGARLVVTVDTGVTGVEQVEHARSLGVEVIVTDHHQPGAELPAALAVVNPNRRDCPYPNKYLTGVGVAFKLAHALLKGIGFTPQEALPFLRSLLDLVAIGTIADYAPLLGENRALVSYGLEQMRRTTNPGVEELKRLVQLNGRVTTQQVGFQIAPRLNAAGRTDHAGICVELLTTKDAKRAAEIAAQLDGLNQHRRGVESQIFEQCLSFVTSQLDPQRDRVFVLSGEQWHLGVVGIVASRIMDIYDRPVIVLSEQNGAAKGSARSVHGFNIHAALTACGEYLTKFGGHPNAAGLQLDCSNIARFREAINAYALEACGPDDTPGACLTIDTEVHVRELDDALMRDLSLLEPHGHSNPAPLLSAGGLKMSEPPRIVGTNHLRLQLRQEERTVNAIGFNMGSMIADLQANRSSLVDVAFAPTINTYFTQPRVEMELKDLKLRPAS